MPKKCIATHIVYAYSDRAHGEADGALNVKINALALDGAQAEPLGATVEAVPAANGGELLGVQDMTSSRGGDVKAFKGYLYNFDRVLKVRAARSVLRVHFYT